MKLTDLLENLFRDAPETELDEMSGFSRLRRMLTGGVDTVNRIGLLTANNPMIQKFSKRENEVLNKRLEQDLRQMGYGYIPVNGKYGNLEYSFLVPNITREETLFLGKKYQQHSVIWGQREEGEGLDGFRFEMIECDGERVTMIGHNVLTGVEVQSSDDYFSSVPKLGQQTVEKGLNPKERKFVIPFNDI